MNIFDVVLLSIIESVTEFIPISSTGHMILFSHLVGNLQNPHVQAFIIIVQLFAILAAVGAYWEVLKNLKNWFLVIVGFLPTVVLGPWLKNFAERWLQDPIYTAWGMILGGLGLAILTVWAQKHKTFEDDENLLTLKKAFLLGFFQLLAFWPGFSRSGALIMGAFCLGLNPIKVRHFIFLLGVPTIGAASLYKFWKVRPDLFSGPSLIWIVGFGISLSLSFLTIRFSHIWLRPRILLGLSLYRVALGLIALVIL